jgi:hypothetical protein
MPKHHYEVTVRCPEAHLPTFLSAVTGYVTLVSVKAIEQPAIANGDNISPVTGKEKKQFRYNDGKRDKGITGRDLILSLLADGPKPKNHVLSQFKARGFAHNSFSASLSPLTRGGQVMVQGDKLFLIK